MADPTPRRFFLLGGELFGTMSLCSFRAKFGVSPLVCSVAWERMRPYHLGPKHQPKHMLWALTFLKLYDSEAALAAQAATSEPTFMKWVKITCRSLQAVFPEVVSADCTAVCANACYL